MPQTVLPSTLWDKAVHQRFPGVITLRKLNSGSMSGLHILTKKLCDTNVRLPEAQQDCSRDLPASTRPIRHTTQAVWTDTPQCQCGVGRSGRNDEDRSCWKWQSLSLLKQLKHTHLYFFTCFIKPCILFVLSCGPMSRISQCQQLPDSPKQRQCLFPQTIQTISSEFRNNFWIICPALTECSFGLWQILI